MLSIFDMEPARDKKSGVEPWIARARVPPNVCRVPRLEKDRHDVVLVVAPIQTGHVRAEVPVGDDHGLDSRWARPLGKSVI